MALYDMLYDTYSGAAEDQTKCHPFIISTALSKACQGHEVDVLRSITINCSLPLNMLKGGHFEGPTRPPHPDLVTGAVSLSTFIARNRKLFIRQGAEGHFVFNFWKSAIRVGLNRRACEVSTQHFIYCCYYRRHHTIKHI